MWCVYPIPSWVLGMLEIVALTSWTPQRTTFVLTAAIPNHYKLDGLKQYKFSYSYRGSEVKNSLTGLKARCQQDRAFGSSREEAALLPCLFQLLLAASAPRFVATSSAFKTRPFNLCCYNSSFSPSVVKSLSAFLLEVTFTDSRD